MYALTLSLTAMGWLPLGSEFDYIPEIENGELYISNLWNDTIYEEDEFEVILIAPIGAVKDFTFEFEGYGTEYNQAEGVAIISATSKGNYLAYEVIEGQYLELNTGNMYDSLSETTIWAETIDDAGTETHIMKIETTIDVPDKTVKIYWDDELMHTEEFTNIPEDESYSHVAINVYGDTVDMYFDNSELSFEQFSSTKEIDLTQFVKQNYPNPFNDFTTIPYKIDMLKDFVKISIFNSSGQLIDVALNTTKNPGDYEFILNRNDLPDGLYFYKIETSTYSQMNKMLIMH